MTRIKKKKQVHFNKNNPNRQKKLNCLIFLYKMTIATTIHELRTK